MNFVRERDGVVRKAIADKHVDLDLDRLLALDDEVRRARGALDELRAERKRVSDGFRTADPADKPALGARSKGIGAEIAAGEASLGEREAELICAGIRQAVPLGQEPHLLMDIGGGSVEFIIADETTIFWKQSFEIGAQRLLDRFFPAPEGVMPAASVAAEQEYLNNVLAPLYQGTDMGALPQLRAATDPGAIGGQYFGPDGFGEQRGYPVVVASSRVSHDTDAQRRLWTVSEELTGVRFPVPALV